MGIMKDFDIRIRNGGDDAIAAASEFAMEAARLAHGFVPLWIPVSKRMPGISERVLVFCPLLEPDEIIGSTRAANGIWECDDGQILGETEPTHWMPLPAPPTDAK